LSRSRKYKLVNINLRKFIIKNILSVLSPEDFTVINDILCQQKMRNLNMQRYRNKFSNQKFLQRITSPASPTQEDLELYKKYLPQNGTVVLLGSTPTIRDLLTDLEINYIVADSSFRMIENSLQLTQKANQEKETWLKSEWSEMPLANNFFDCIIGDLVINQILPSNQDSFFKKIHHLLIPGGIFVTRTQIVNSSLENLNSNEIIQSIIEGGQIIGIENERVKFYSALCNLLSAFRDKDNQVFDPKKTLDALINYPPRSQDEREWIKKIFKVFLHRANERLEYSIQTENKIETKLQKYFKIENKSFSSDYPDTKYFPVYCLKNTGTFNS